MMMVSATQFYRRQTAGLACLLELIGEVSQRGSCTAGCLGCVRGQRFADIASDLAEFGRIRLCELLKLTQYLG